MALSFIHRNLAAAVATSVGLVISAEARAGQPIFVVQFAAGTEAIDAFKPQIEATLLRAAGMWAAEINAQPVTIEITVMVAGVPRATGRSVTSAFVGVVNGRNVFQQGAAHELRTGIDPNGATADIEIVFNPSYVSDILWFDPDPSADPPNEVPVDRTEAMSVLLHELGHAFAYNGWANGNGGIPATFMSPWDRWVRPASPDVFFDGPWTVRTWGVPPDITIGNPSHWGNGFPVVLAGLEASAHLAAPGDARWDAQNQVWCPAPARPLHCAAHSREPSEPVLAEQSSPRGSLIPQLMNGVVFYHGTRYRIGELDRAVLRDTGHLTPRLPCQWDFDADGAVNVADLVQVLASFSSCPGDAGYFPPADLDQVSNCINTADLVLFLNQFGVPCP
ncbi:MAG: hypothetical protein ACKVZJ_09995 [Phycisphaerales bacterium]